MLQIIINVLHFLRFLVFGIWRTSCFIGFWAVVSTSKLLEIAVKILHGMFIVCDDFRQFVYALKQSIEDTIYICRSFINRICEFLLDFFTLNFKSIQNLPPTKHNIQNASLGIVDLFLRSFFLIADCAWWLITIIPRSIVKLFVAAADFVVFSLDTARVCLCYFVGNLVQDTMRTALSVIIIFIIVFCRQELLRMINLLGMNLSAQIRLNLARLRYIWRRHRSSSFPQRSIRRSPRRSSTPLNDSKLLDHQRCVVCRCRSKSVVLWPCRHLCLCDECADILNRQYTVTCPLCRTDVELTISVYT